MARQRNVTGDGATRWYFPPKLYQLLYSELAKKYGDGTTINPRKIEEALRAKKRTNRNIQVPDLQTINNILADTSKPRQKRYIESLIRLAFDTDLETWMKNNLSSDEKPIRALGKSPVPVTKNTGTTPSPQAPVTAYASFDPLLVINTLTSTAQEEIWLFGSSLDTMLKHRAVEIVDAMQRGVTIHLIAFSPNAPQSTMEEVSSVFGYPSQLLINEYQQTVKWAVHLMDRWRQVSDFNPLRLDLRLTNQHPRMRLFITDPNSAQAIAFFVPAINQIISTDLPMFHTSPSATNITAPYLRGVKKVWESATPIQTFLAEHPEYLEGFDGLLESFPIPHEN